MKRNLALLWEDKVLRRGTKINLILIAFIFLTIGFFWRELPPQVPLFYSRPWGSSQLTANYYLFLLPGISLSILGVNMSISLRLLKQFRLLSHLVMGVSILVSILAAITNLRIILLIR